MAQNKTSHILSAKKKIAVFFGGRSPEHDVSVISGLQVLQAIDQSLYDAFPVYIAPDGAWYVGDALRHRSNFLLSRDILKTLHEVTLDVQADRGGVLLPKVKPSFFRKGMDAIAFDIAVPVFHGGHGEDGGVQGLFELANIPYAGMRVKASSLLMDKVTSKYFMQALDIPVLPFASFKRPDQGYLIAEDVIAEKLSDLTFPAIVKPAHMGSSIGVAKVNNVDEVKAALPAIFEYDDVAIVEPFVAHMVEYNVSVMRALSGDIVLSAIERPKNQDELLDFKAKYMSGGNDKGGDKISGNKIFSTASEGMLSLTRDINPDLSDDVMRDIHAWSVRMFDAIDGTGAPRIDFIGNKETGEIWLNEVNPLPGSFAYFLWEAALDPVLFTDFLSVLIEEAVQHNISRYIPHDPVPAGARLLKRNV